jgi:RNA polymerase sigma factor (sigma-70 family)
MGKDEADKLFESNYRLIREKAKRHARNVRQFDGATLFEDLVQEGLLAAWTALHNYDEEKAKIGTFTGNVIWRHLQGVLGRELAQKRIPHVWRFDTHDGCWVYKPHTDSQRYDEQDWLGERITANSVYSNRLQDLDPTMCDYILDMSPTPDQIHDWGEDEKIMALLRLRVLYRLRGRDGQVFMAKLIPADPDDNSNVKIAGDLSLTVNQVNYSLAKIRGVVNEVIAIDK